MISRGCGVQSVVGILAVQALPVDILGGCDRVKTVLKSLNA
jgi:hypothetical protein